MLFGEYLNKLCALAESRPEVLNYQVVTSSDDEGNEYREVEGNIPTVGTFTGFDFYTKGKDNAVCVN